jgi:argininosuccinate lyase
MWGGRFRKPPDPTFVRFTSSLPFDWRLWRQDVRGSIAHANMLGRQGIIPRGEASRIVRGLKAIHRDLENEEKKHGKPALDPASEDIHTEIERRLRLKVGDLAGKLRTGRSRNDQVALDLRLFLADEIPGLIDRIGGLQGALVKRAEEHLNAKPPTVVPGYTHGQLAEPVLLSHHLLAYFWKLQRDRERLVDCLKRVNVSPLGAAAIAGTSLPIRPAVVAKELGFSATFENSMDAVSDRDFALDFLAACAIAMLHLSSIAESLIQWAGPDPKSALVVFDDAWSSGSSIMPHKRNPDGAELISAKAGRAVGNLNRLVGALKGLSHPGYELDLQEDKEAVFDSLDTLNDSLAVMIGIISTVTFRAERMREALEKESWMWGATEAAEYLAKKGLPFTRAHEVVGKVVAYCEKAGRSLRDLALRDWQRFCPRFGEDLLERLTLDRCVASKASPGGTAPQRVREQLRQAKRLLAAYREKACACHPERSEGSHNAA